MMRIALIGPYPPPIGGIAVHIQRMEKRLKDEGYSVTVYPNISTQKWLLFHGLEILKLDVLHFHEFGWFNRLLLGCLSFLGAPVALTLHGESIRKELLTLPYLFSWLLRWSLKQIPAILTVNPEIREFLLEQGIDPERVEAIHTFLLPSTDLEALPIKREQFLRTHHPVLAVSGFRIIPYRDNDLYGIKLSLSLCDRLKDKFPDLGLLIYLAEIGDDDYFTQLQETLATKNLERKVEWVIGESLLPILPRLSIFVRPTYEDGYGLSIAEALYFGVPTIASDVCKRPAGTILFRVGDLTDFYSKVSFALSNYPKVKRAARATIPDDAFPGIIAAYHRISGGPC